MIVTNINAAGSRPRKGSFVSHILNTKCITDFFSIVLDNNDFIYSINCFPLNMNLFSLVQDDDSGIEVQFTRQDIETSLGVYKRVIIIDIGYIAGDSIYSFEVDLVDVREVILAYKRSEKILTVYYLGRSIELTFDNFNPTRFDTIADNNCNIIEIAEFTFYNLSEITNIDIPVQWRIDYKEQLETDSGYAKFAEDFKAYEKANDMFMSNDQWSLRGLWVDPPRIEDFLGRENGTMS